MTNSLRDRVTPEVNRFTLPIRAFRAHTPHLPEPRPARRTTPPRSPLCRLTALCEGALPLAGTALAILILGAAALFTI